MIPRSWRSEAGGKTLAAVALSLVVAAVLGSCKNSTAPEGSAAAEPAPAIPVVAALPGGAAGWTGASWLPLVQPLKETRTVPSTRVACTYDAQRLYVAMAGIDGGGGMKISLFLDTRKNQDGKNYLGIEAAVEGGKAAVKHVVWYKPSQPLAPNPDGTVSYATPVVKVPGLAVEGLEVRAEKTTVDGQPGWNVVFAVPVLGLPGALKNEPAAGLRWRVNLLREDDLGAGPGGRREVVAGALSPVYLGHEAMMPYRMAELILAPAGGVAKGSGESDGEKYKR